MLIIFLIDFFISYKMKKNNNPKIFRTKRITSSVTNGYDWPRSDTLHSKDTDDEKIFWDGTIRSLVKCSYAKQTSMSKIPMLNCFLTRSQQVSLIVSREQY